jgi:hypothetical protein
MRKRVKKKGFRSPLKRFLKKSKNGMEVSMKYPDRKKNNGIWNE